MGDPNKSNESAYHIMVIMNEQHHVNFIWCHGWSQYWQSKKRKPSV